MSFRRAQQGGFTLLEVMIAMAILALALAALLGNEGISIQMSDFSNRLTQATLLAQGKMYDVENTLLDDGMESLDDCEEGDFRSEDFRRFRWKACAYKLELDEGATENLQQEFLNLLGGMGMEIQDGSGGVAGQIMQASAAIPTFLQQLEDKVRKVRLEVSWKDAVGKRQVVFERFITSLGADPHNGPPPKDGEGEGAVEEQLMDVLGKRGVLP